MGLAIGAPLICWRVRGIIKTCTPDYGCGIDLLLRCMPIPLAKEIKSPGRKIDVSPVGACVVYVEISVGSLEELGEQMPVCAQVPRPVIRGLWPHYQGVFIA